MSKPFVSAFAHRASLLAAFVTLAGSSASAAPPRDTILVGRCTPVNHLAATKQAGFAFFEIGVQRYARLSDTEFAALRKEVKQLGVKVPVSNSFVPSDIKLVGPEANLDIQNAYITVALSRAKQLGVKTVVFGSGGARKLPDGFPRDQALYQLIDFGRRAAAEAKKHGITIAVEPLNRGETNIFNTAAEALDYVAAVDRPNFALMVDYYHMLKENEGFDVILRAGKRLKHVHIAAPDRSFPRTPDEANYAMLFETLRKIGYRGGVSVEANDEPQFDEVAPKTIAMLQDLLAASRVPKPTP